MPAIYFPRPGPRVTITNSKYAGCRAVIEANVYDKRVDFPHDRTAGFQDTVFVGDTRVWATVRVEQVRGY